MGKPWMPWKWRREKKSSMEKKMIDRAGMVAEADAGAAKAGEIVAAIPDGAAAAKKYEVSEASNIAQEAAPLPVASGGSISTTALEKRLERVEAKLEAVMKEVPRLVDATLPVDSMAQTFVAPCDANAKTIVRRYVGTVDGSSGDKGVAIYIGIPRDQITDSPQPTCIVVSYEQGSAWKEGDGVTVVLDGETITGEVVSLIRKAPPCVAAIELFERPRVSEVPLDPFWTKEAIFVRLGGVEGVELRSGTIDEIYMPSKVAGHVAGVRVGDAIMRWDKTGKLLVSGLVCSTDDDGAVFGVSVHDMTTYCLELDKKAWYRTKYPHRRLRRANYGYT